MCWWKLGILYELYREMELVDGNLIERSSFFQNIRFHFQSFQGGWIWLRKSKNNCLSKISGHFFWKSDILRFMGLPTRSSHLGCRFIWPNIFIWTVHDVKGMFKMVNMTFRNKKKQSHVIVLPEFVIKLVEITFLWIWAKARSWILVKTWFFWRCAFSKLLHGISSYTFWALKKVSEDILRQCQVQKWILWKN